MGGGEPSVTGGSGENCSAFVGQSCQQPVATSDV